MGKGDLYLKVQEEYAEDAGRGIVRIDQDSRDIIAAETGDIIEIKGRKQTAAKCSPLFPPDEGKKIIRIDGLIRHNAGIEIGDAAAIRKIMAAQAEKAILVPVESIPPIDGKHIADELEGSPLIKGNHVMVPYFGGRLAFEVAGTTPADDIVLMTKSTIVMISARDGAPRDAS